MSDDLPWSDCKVAFGIKDPENAWLLHRNPFKTMLPDGWSLDETDCSGARCVVVFRVDIIPTKADGNRVLQALRDVDAI